MSAALISFYSFKGGVGRTQALANVAAALSLREQRVIVVDMDLESPGLHRYFGPMAGGAWTDDDLSGSDRRGVLEYFAEAVELPDAEPRLSLLPCARAQANSGPGSIRLVLPGRLDDTYPERVSRLSFDDLYQSFEGYDYVEAFRRQLISADADVVLVDSSSGMTGAAGVCAFQLPDVTVAMFALHQQGVEGVHQVARGIERARVAFAGDARRRELLLLPARVEESGDRRDQWLTQAAQRMSDVDGIFLGGLGERIPYDPGAAFGEDIVVGRQPSNLARAYEHLADRLLVLARRATS